jgi:hypothetical protein
MTTTHILPGVKSRIPGAQDKHMDIETPAAANGVTTVAATSAFVRGL